VILADIDKCVGCRSCEVACAKRYAKESPEEDVPISRDLILASRKMHVGISMGGTKPMPIQCRHCEDPTCLFACISGAIHRDAGTGMVLIDQDKCVGCWTCLKMCSFFSILPDVKGSRVLKCDKCMEEERPPPCVKACPMEVLFIEEVEKIDEEKCFGCGLCESLCLRGALTLEETDRGRKARIDKDKCKGCGICAASCPRDAIVMMYFTDERAKDAIHKLVESPV
jgi:carbon-monoxide dehydrogenase iron sulfur subunit